MANPENFTYERKYTLASTEINTLACRLLQSQPPKTSDRFICYLLSSADEISNLARHAEREAFLEYYGPYELSSTFFVVMDTTYNKPAGVVRIVKNSLAGIPTLNDAPKYIGVTLDKFKAYHKVDNLDTVWDISTVVVLKDYRRIEEIHGLVVEAVKAADGKLRPSAELFKRRWLDGEGIDHRFMFQFSKDIGYDSATDKKLSAKL
ncbi:hypothetical protein DL96DRAFT_1778230 [Flagelloscypha sp. PMI_526]|nr:hypothetical protein DL96DRAFT_1778230 [Flagelloscypha sp. PMI_526]